MTITLETPLNGMKPLQVVQAILESDPIKAYTISDIEWVIRATNYYCPFTKDQLRRAAKNLVKAGKAQFLKGDTAHWYGVPGMFYVVK